MKRAIDITIAILGLLLLSPIFLIVALLVGIKMGTPVLFRQERPGFRAKSFTLLKFRTMLDNPSNGRGQTDADRLTKLGLSLRSTSLDELPELWNVLKGNMSLVGPRPLLMEYLEHYTPRQSRRHEVKPGITGWAQINGRNALTWDEKFEYDVWYVDHQSLELDMYILMMTLIQVLRREGISHPGFSTMTKFGVESEPPPEIN